MTAALGALLARISTLIAFGVFDEGDLGGEPTVAIFTRAAYPRDGEIAGGVAGTLETHGAPGHETLAAEGMREGGIAAVTDIARGRTDLPVERLCDFVCGDGNGEDRAIEKHEARTGGVWWCRA